MKTHVDSKITGVQLRSASFGRNLKDTFPLDPVLPVVVAGSHDFCSFHAIPNQHSRKMTLVIRNLSAREPASDRTDGIALRRNPAGQVPLAAYSAIGCEWESWFA